MLLNFSVLIIDSFKSLVPSKKKIVWLPLHQNPRLLDSFA